MTTKVTSLLDELTAWRGTAAELAERVNALLPRLNLRDEGGSINERLVRYYVTHEVLTPPVREGREALFGFRQAVELLVTRCLLADGWPLAKIAAMVRSADLAALEELLPAGRPRTAAEELVFRFRREAGAHRSGSPGRPPPARSFSPSALELAADLTRRKTALADNLKALGSADGRPGRRRIIQIDLTPWCQVQVDASELHALGDEATVTLGAALIQALQQERSRPQERT